MKSTNYKFALFTDRGETLGFYETRRDAEADLRILDDPDDVAIIELDELPGRRTRQTAALRLLTRIGEAMGYR